MEEILKLFLVPSGIISFLLLCGIILLAVKRAGKAGKIFLAAGAGAFLVFGFGPTGSWLLGTLEDEYPPLRDLKKAEQIDTILILSGYAEKDLHADPSSEVNFASAFRIMETIRILAAHPGKKVLISGHAPVAGILKSLMVKLGVPQNQIEVDELSESTYKSAVNNSERLKDKPFILVTSAGHMPRAMGVFKKLGMNPIPAPTNYLSKKDYPAATFLPSPQNLLRSDLAVHEYLGLAWYWMTDRI
jgi:uncharacterized SAM-binding protein YcdF (DUF218 family)